MSKLDRKAFGHDPARHPEQTTWRSPESLRARKAIDGMLDMLLDEEMTGVFRLIKAMLVLPPSSEARSRAAYQFQTGLALLEEAWRPRVH